MTYVVASLVERSISGLADSSKEAFRQGADLVEVRLDHLRLSVLDRRNLSRIREAVRGPAIATLRSSDEGGRSGLRGRAREKALRAVLGAGFEYIDLELAMDRKLLDEARGRSERPGLIASHHFARPASRKEVESRLREACRSGDFGKVAMPCADAGDAVMLASLGVKHSLAGDRFTLIGMGEQGVLTRVCARQMGSSMVYCCLQGRPAAPGQLEIGQQSSLDGGDRTVLGLLGHPLDHSVSRPMQEAALRRAGMTGAYLNLDIPPRELRRDTLDTLCSVGFSGLNVTIPLKEKACSLCDRLSPEAEATGAVNTLMFRGNDIHGENTDVIGFTRAITRKMCIDQETEALVVGAGGASRAAVFALTRASAHVTVASRTPGRAEKVAADLGAEPVPLTSLRREDRRFDLIVNATPVGTRGVGGAAPIPGRLFSRGTLFFDMVYNPAETRTMKAAKARGARALGGLDMLVNQGAESFRLWTGVSPDVKAMRSAARRALP